MKLIILNGGSCSGKSSISKNLMTKKDGLFYLHYDSIKWFFSKYSREKYSTDVQKIVLAVAKEAFFLGYDVISEASLTQSFREKIIKLAIEKKYEVIEINLEADFEILLKRFNERVESALKIPEKDRRIANISVVRFKELFDIYNNEKNVSALTFRTDEESIEEITEKINKMF